MAAHLVWGFVCVAVEELINEQELALYLLGYVAVFYLLGISEGC